MASGRKNGLGLTIVPNTSIPPDDEGVVHDIASLHYYPVLIISTRY
jgi:hypothetical protein